MWIIYKKTKKISKILKKQEIDNIYYLADKLIIRKFDKRKVHSLFKDNIWSVDLAKMILISKFYKGIRFLLCFIDIFSKYAWVIPLKDKKGITITNAFQKILDESNRHVASKFYNR